MVKSSSLIKVFMILFVLAIPFAVGCGGSGSGVVPKSESTGPEPQRVQRSVSGAGESGAKPLGN